MKWLEQVPLGLNNKFALQKKPGPFLDPAFLIDDIAIEFIGCNTSKNASYTIKKSNSIN